MKKYKYLPGLFILIMGVVAFCLTTIAADDQETNKKGIVTYVEGQAKKRQLPDEQWQSAYKDTQVVTGDQVRTFRQSRAELELDALDRIRMAPMTTIDIVKLYEETRQEIREAHIKVQEGDIWANINKDSTNRKFQISTPIAAMAITGTIFRTHVDRDSSSELRVYRGEVIISNAPEPDKVKPKTIEPYQIEGPHEIPGPHEVSLQEWALIVKSMQKVAIGKNGMLKFSGSFADTDSDEQTDWVKWNKMMDQKFGQVPPLEEKKE